MVQDIPFSQSGEYAVVRTIGAGTSGRALLAKKRSDQSDEPKLYVLKEIRLSNTIDPREKMATKREVQILSKLQHPNIIRYYDSFEASGYLYIVTEYAERGDLYSFIKSRRRVSYIPEEMVMSYFVQLCVAIKYLHKNKILHRDLKTRNIFLSSENLVKVGDFGISKILGSTADFAVTTIGTPYYLSPEICENKQYGFKSDMWSVGCVLYELLALKHAFDAKNMKGLIFKILRGQYVPIPEMYSMEVENLLSKLLVTNPEGRFGIDEVFGMPIIQRALESFLVSLKSAGGAFDTLKLKPPVHMLKDISGKFNTLMKSFGEEQAFVLIIQWLYGQMPISRVLERYKKKEGDSYTDILSRIQAESGAHQENDMDAGSTADLIRTMEDMLVIEKKPLYTRLGSEEYMIDGKRFRYGEFCLKRPDVSPLSLYIPSLGRCLSVYQRIEVVRDYLVRVLGRQVLVGMYSVLRKLVDENSGHEDWKAHLKKSIDEKQYSMLEETGHLHLLLQVIINEKNYYH